MVVIEGQGLSFSLFTGLVVTGCVSVGYTSRQIAWRLEKKLDTNNKNISLFYLLPFGNLYLFK